MQDITNQSKSTPLTYHIPYHHSGNFGGGQAFHNEQPSNTQGKKSFTGKISYAAEGWDWKYTVYRSCWKELLH
jgi:hypothetical protein